MNHASLRQVTQLPARRAQAPGQIDVFAIEKKFRIEAADLFESPTPQQYRGATDPLGFQRHRVIVLRVFIRSLAKFPRGSVLVAGSLGQDAFERSGQECSIRIQQQQPGAARLPSQRVVALPESKIALTDFAAQRTEVLGKGL